MRLSIFDDEIGLDITQGISHFQEWGLEWVHLPGPEQLESERKKLEGIVRAADKFDCRLVRSFFYWQPEKDQQGALAMRPDELQKVLDRHGPSPIARSRRG